MVSPSEVASWNSLCLRNLARDKRVSANHMDVQGGRSTLTRKLEGHTGAAGLRLSRHKQGALLGSMCAALITTTHGYDECAYTRHLTTFTQAYVYSRVACLRNIYNGCMYHLLNIGSC